ncbi:ABC transporter substrate-binding protein [Xylophilus sp. ASV27]|uniref:ABC transporter substrate-binding protein n=1 Tax=Xylophilus sp. ASV27 TaxID=2795129 RepID=UPI0018ED27C8|nr:ABC transporter substrate-binding protein [Xylophilus sp. ASV27]
MQLMRHSFRRLAAAAVAALATAAASMAGAETLSLVSIQSMTGPTAFAGAIFQKAIQLAVDEANQKGGIHGRRISVIEHDNASDKGQAINLANQAIDRDRALFVLGPTTTADTLAVAPIFNDKRTPFIGFAGSDAILKAGPWTLKFRQGTDVDGPVLAQYVLQKTPVRRVALVFDRTNEALIEFKNVFRDAFKAGGGTVVAEEAVVSSDANFLPLATKLKAMDIDAVYLTSYAEQSGNIALQLRQAGLPEKVRILGSLAIVSPKFLSVAGKAAEGVIAISDYVPGMDRPLNKAFDAAYQARYGTEPDSYAATGYSLAKVALATLQEAGPHPTREKVREAYLRLKEVPVVVGTGVWSHAERRPNYGALVLGVKDGRFVIAP